MPKAIQTKEKKKVVFFASDPFFEYLPLLRARRAQRRADGGILVVLKNTCRACIRFLWNLLGNALGKKQVFFVFSALLVFVLSLAFLPRQTQKSWLPALKAETATREIGVPRTTAVLWQGIRGHYGGLSSREGLAHWLWQRRDEYHSLSTRQLSRLQRSEEGLRKYLDSPRLYSVFSSLAFELQFQGTPIFTYERGMTRQSPHSLASISKTFTAVAVLKLVALQKIALDDDIAMYFPEVLSLSRPLGGVPIRVRDLLQHSSGISYQPSITANIAALHRLRRAFYPIARQFMEAGKKFHYSNYNYYILAALIERISNRSYADFLRQEIFVPLHLQNTSVSAASTGAAGLRSSSEDLAVFLNTLFGEKRGRASFLPKNLVLEMIRKPDYLKLQPGMSYYGLGIRGQYHKGKLSSVYHTGLWKHTLSEMRYYISEQVALVHLSSPNYFRSPSVGRYRYQSVFLAEKYIRKVASIFMPPLSSKKPRLVLKNQ